MPKILGGNDTGAVTLLNNPYQQAFLNARRQRLKDGSRAYNRLTAIAGRQGGKTLAGAIMCVEEASEVPKSLHWACAPSYPELWDYVLPTVGSILPRSWIADWSAQHAEYTLINGAKVQFRSLDDPERARGPHLWSAWFDEARKIAPVAWDTIQPALARHRAVAIFTTSPNGFDWVYKKLWLPAVEGRPGYWACRYKTIDNPSIPREEIESAKASMDPLFYQQEYEADFVCFTGAVYGAMLEPQILHTDDQVRKVLPEYPAIDASRPAFSGLDPGADHPFAGVLVVSTPAGLVVFREYCERNRPIAEHVLGIREMEAPLKIEQRAIDRSQRQTAFELLHHSLHVIPAENNVVAGIHRTQTWLKAGKLWFVEKNVPRTIEQMRGLRWEENYAKDGEAKRERVMKVNDDLPDALRYALMLWPELPEAEQPLVGRDPRTIPAEARWAWDRMQRIDHADEEKDALDWGQFLATDSGFGDETVSDRPLGDFYG